MPRFANRKDHNHNAIVTAIKQAGGDFIDCSVSPQFGCDGLILCSSLVIFCEIKNSSQVKSKRSLTSGEASRKQQVEANGCQYVVLETEQQAFNFVRSLKLSSKDKQTCDNLLLKSDAIQDLERHVKGVNAALQALKR